MESFKIPQAQPDTEATMCEYMSLCEHGKTCDIDPEKDYCALGQVGKISKDGSAFTPKEVLKKGIYVSTWWCPRIEANLKEMQIKCH